MPVGGAADRRIAALAACQVGDPPPRRAVVPEDSVAFADHLVGRTFLRSVSAFGGSVPGRSCDQLKRELGSLGPFPIQSAVLPDALAGRRRHRSGPTGSGKTLAFGVPIVADLERGGRRRPTALVLAPARELAEQIAGSCVRWP